jgi:hypothetical protein
MTKKVKKSLNIFFPLDMGINRSVMLIPNRQACLSDKMHQENVLAEKHFSEKINSLKFQGFWSTRILGASVT